MLIWEIAILSAIGAIMLTAVSKKLMQILQLSSYRVRGVFGWLKRTKFDYAIRYFALAFFCFTSVFVFIACFGNTGAYSFLGIIFFIFICFYFCVAVNREKQKTPLKRTNRIIRLTIVDFICNYGLSFLLIWAGGAALKYSLLGVAPLLCIFTLIIAYAILYPVEWLIGRKFIIQAQKKLAASAPIVIGITGSFGKTTAKNILARFLAVKYKVFASPSSFNTPMGLCKCINDDYKGEEIFIAEMGARFVGDIGYLKKLFAPKYAMVTGVGNMHLETFGSRENIVKEKLSILDGVDYGVANGDIPELRQALQAKNAHLCGHVGEATYDDVKYSLLGTDFTLTIGEESVHIHTRLVGDHIPIAVTMCACLAAKLNVSLEEIAESAEKLPFIEHRLEVLNSGDIIILDDSYNSNPTGAKNALNLLKTFEGNKVIITPGFVELGEDSQSCHRELGEQIASVCDYAFIMGGEANEIKAGMGDFENVAIVGSLDEAMDRLKEIELPMAVLFENDLPDNY